MSLMEQFTNPETMHALSFGEKMAGSTITMLMGLGVTFLILCILWAFIVLMGKVMGAVDGKKAAPKAAPAAAAAPVATKAAPAAGGSDEETAAVIAAALAASDDVLPAVIAAAIAAYEGSGIPNNLVVRKIRRIPNNTTLWMDAARDDVIDTRRF
ncbi:MAG: OadG family protein [Firmicutes bacterium]|nr:OadG family protein [Bacillota bacterium]